MHRCRRQEILDRPTVDDDTRAVGNHTEDADDQDYDDTDQQDNTEAMQTAPEIPTTVSPADQQDPLPWSAHTADKRYECKEHIKQNPNHVFLAFVFHVSYSHSLAAGHLRRRPLQQRPVRLGHVAVRSNVWDLARRGRVQCASCVQRVRQAYPFVRGHIRPPSLVSVGTFWMWHSHTSSYGSFARRISRSPPEPEPGPTEKRSSITSTRKVSALATRRLSLNLVDASSLVEAMQQVLAEVKWKVWQEPTRRFGGSLWEAGNTERRKLSNRLDARPLCSLRVFVAASVRLPSITN